MILIPDYVSNSEKIVQICMDNLDKFKPRVGDLGHTGTLPVNSQFSSWMDKDMSEDFIDLLFENNKFDDDLRDLYFFIQIQRYEPGDYIVPHRDNYSVQKLHLISLTTSDCDGLIFVEDNKVNKIYDKAGQKIDANMSNFHWVDPVRDLRFSLVVGE